MLDTIQRLRTKLRDGEGTMSRVGVELNTSCPNIKGSTPPAYHMPSLAPILDVLARYFREDPTLVIGLKLPPYVYSTQFDDLLRGIATYSQLSLREISIIGVGGVTTREAHLRMRRAGASVVACATILIRNGVSGFQKLSITDDNRGSGRGGTDLGGLSSGGA